MSPSPFIQTLMSMWVELQIKILQATGLPQHLSNFVFCQYSFWDQSEPTIVAPEVDPSSSSPNSKDPHCMVVFDSCKVNTDLLVFRIADWYRTNTCLTLRKS